MKYFAIPITIQVVPQNLQQTETSVIPQHQEIDPLILHESQQTAAPLIPLQSPPDISQKSARVVKPLQQRYTNPPLVCDAVAVQALANQKKRKVNDSQTRDIVMNVLKKCAAEYRKGKLELPFQQVRARTRMYTGVAESTINRIKKHPLLKLTRRRTFKSVLDDRDMILIKNLIRDHYIKHCTVPSVKHLWLTILDEIPTFCSSDNHLHNVLPYMGYRKKKHYSKRSVLIEDATILAFRDNYLRTMMNMQNQTSIFYIYECIIDESLTFHKAWPQKYGCNHALHDKNTLTFLCAASKDGFLKTSALLRRTYVDEDRDGRLTPELFEKWVQDFLIPHLPEHSIVVMEDAPHHCVLKDKPISYHASKQNIVEYLRKKDIVCDISMRRSKLYKLVEKNVPKDKTFIVDNILEQNGHKGMRLPPYMIDLSPMQLAMDKIQKTLFENDLNIKLNVKNVLEIIEVLMRTIRKEDWEEFVAKVQALEEDCWRKDGEFDVALDKVLLNLRDCVDSGSDDSDFDSGSEYSDH